MFDEQESTSSLQYLVPANVSAKFEFIDGFGWSELKIVLFATFIGIALAFLSSLFVKVERIEKENLTVEQSVGLQENYLIKKTPYVPAPIKGLMVIVPAAGSFMVVRRNPTTGLSLIRFLIDMKDFKKKQKLYLYRYNSGSEEG